MSFHSLYKTFRHLFGRDSDYEPLILIEISRGAILHNIHAYLQTYPNMQVAPVLKSNAYGHGIREVAHIIKNEPLPFVVVDSLYEARVLRCVDGFQIPILVIGYTEPRTIIKSRISRTHFTVVSLAQLRELSTIAQKSISIQLKIDTGMHRQGIDYSEIDDALTIIKNNTNLSLIGICSHLADADTKESGYTKKQIERWNAAVKKCTDNFPSIVHIHLSATAGALESAHIKANTVRLGLGLYGIDAAPQEKINLIPPLSMKTRISSIRTVPEGEPIGYNCTYTTKRDSRIATIPVGYYEGIDRRLSNNGSILVKNIPCPIVGRVSMNITCIDVTHLDSCEVGDTAILISNSPKDENSVTSIAKRCNTIPWEILVHIPPHLRRTITD